MEPTKTSALTAEKAKEVFNFNHKDYLVGFIIIMVGKYLDRVTFI